MAGLRHWLWHIDLHFVYFVDSLHLHGHPINFAAAGVSTLLNVPVNAQVIHSQAVSV